MVGLICLATYSRSLVCQSTLGEVRKKKTREDMIFDITYCNRETKRTKMQRHEEQNRAEQARIGIE